MNRPHVDDLDRAIIRALLPDARITNRQIAAALGVTEGTIRARIRRLEQNRLLRFTAFAGDAYVGKAKLAYIGLHVDRVQVYAVAEQIRAIRTINCCVTLLGRFDILAIGMFRDLGHMLEVANGQLAVLPGVRHIETWVAIKAIKVSPQLARLTEDVAGGARAGAQRPGKRQVRRG